MKSFTNVNSILYRKSNQQRENNESLIDEGSPWETFFKWVLKDSSSALEPLSVLASGWFWLDEDAWRQTACMCLQIVPTTSQSGQLHWNMCEQTLQSGHTIWHWDASVQKEDTITTSCLCSPSPDSTNQLPVSFVGQSTDSFPILNFLCDVM